VVEVSQKSIGDCEAQLVETEQELLHSQGLLEAARADEAYKLLLLREAEAELAAALASMDAGWIASATEKEIRARAAYEKAVHHRRRMEQRCSMARECVQMAGDRLQETRAEYVAHRGRLDDVIQVQFGRLAQADERIKNYLSVYITGGSSGQGTADDGPKGDWSPKKSKDQKKAIKEGFRRLSKDEKMSDKEKGNFNEMLMDQYYAKLGYKPLHKTIGSLDDKGHQGIDGVYEKENPDGTKSYIIADAKYGQSPLSTTTDGTKQMSDDWIDKRLDGAVGKEKAEEIRASMRQNPSSVSKEVYHFNPEGDGKGATFSEVYTVDSNGNRNSDKTVVQRFDKHGNEL